MADLIKKIKEWLVVALGAIGAFLLLLLGIKTKKNEKLKEEVSDLKKKVDEDRIRIEKEEKRSEVIEETSQGIMERNSEVIEDLKKIIEDTGETYVPSTNYNEFINKWNEKK